MKRLTPKTQAFTLLLSITALTTGCSGPANNTQRGAATGAALGGIAGAIIGNNRGSGNAASGAAIGAAAGAIAGGAYGHTRDKREAQTTGSGTTYASEDQAMTSIVVSGAPPLPPAPIAETMPQRSDSMAVWVPGYWSYENGSSYVWVPGRWENPPRGRTTFQPPYWAQQGSNHVYVRGHWR